MLVTSLLQGMLRSGEIFSSLPQASTLLVLIGFRNPAIREERQTREPAVVTRDSMTLCCQALLAKVPSKLCSSQAYVSVISDRNHSRSRSQLASILNPDFLMVSHHKNIP